MSKKKNQEPEYVLSRINNPMLNYRRYVPTSAEKVLFIAAAFLGGGAVSLIFFAGQFKVDGVATTATYISNVVIFTIVGLIAAKFLYPSFIEAKKEKRNIKLRDQFRDLLEALSASFSAGVNASEAFQSAYQDMAQQHGDDSFITLELKEILNGQKQNISISEMLADFAERSGNDDIQNFADVYSIAIEKGSDLKTVIRRTHMIISSRIAANDEIETKLASNKLQHRVMSIMPIGIVAILRFTNESFANSFVTPLGIIVNIIAIAAFIGSYRLGQKICNSVK